MRLTRSCETTTDLFRCEATDIVKGTYCPGGVFEIQFKIPVAGLLGRHGLACHTPYLWRTAFTSFVFAHHLPLTPSLLIGAGVLVILALIGGKQIVRSVYEDEPKKLSP
jgi:hypothetical protein